MGTGVVWQWPANIREYRHRKADACSRLRAWPKLYIQKRRDETHKTCGVLTPGHIKHIGTMVPFCGIKLHGRYKCQEQGWLLEGTKHDA